MRIIAGSARGRKLKPVPGEATRPTTDRSKESIFNIIQFDIEGRDALDLFAGSGQLGIEALSRGASSCTFVDMNTKACDAVRENLRSSEFEENATVRPGEALSFISSCRRKFDLIFLDPPYKTPLLKRSIESIASFDICSVGGIIVCECDKAFALPDLPAPYAWGRTYLYGHTKVVLAHRGED